MTHWTLHPQLAADTHHVATLTLCDLQLMDDASYHWLILVPRVDGAVDWIDLDVDQQAQLTREIDTACRTLRASHTPDKLNVAALGNVVPQLHVHVIARFREDPAWPKPVFGIAPAVPYDASRLRKALADLRAALGLRSP